jgi:hypothetical protein
MGLQLAIVTLTKHLFRRRVSDIGASHAREPAKPNLH